MSARPLHKVKRAAEPDATIRDVDLLELFPPTSAANKNAIVLVGLVKVLARGKRFFNVYDQTLWRELGWSEATLRRAKRTCRDAGVLVSQRRGSHGGNVASQWVLDRRWIKGLRRHDEHHLVSVVTPDIVVQNLSDSDLPAVGSESERPRAGPGPPPAEADDQASVTAAEHEPPQTAAPPEQPPEPVTRLLAELRSQLPPKSAGEEGAGPALAEYAFVHAWPFIAELALARLVRELEEQGRPKLAAGVRRAVVDRGQRVGETAPDSCGSQVEEESA